MLAVLLLLATANAYSFKNHELDGLTFQTFLSKTGLVFKPTELRTREDLFLAELARVKAHNAAKRGWTETINKFSAMTVAEKKASFGYHKGVAKAHKALNAKKPTHEIKDISALPANVDWRNAGIVSAVKDQGHCGSCWAFASTAVIESHVAKATSYLFDFSPQQIAMCAPNPDSCGGTGGCYGATAELAFDYIAKAGGILEEYQYGYGAYYGAPTNCSAPALGPYKGSIAGYVKLEENDYASLMNAIAFVGPIAVSVDASSWSAYEGGVFDGCDQKSPDINHAVTLVGYGVEADGTKYWLIRNSWSPTWGEHGYIKIARSDAKEQVCGSDVTPMDGSACSGQTDPVKVCGTCGVLYDSSYPVGASLYKA